MRFHPPRHFIAAFVIGGFSLGAAIFTGCSSDDTVVSVTDSGADDVATESSVVDAGAVGFANASRVVAGDAFACALTTSGDVYCWGGTSAGENGTTTPSSSPLKVTGLPAITMIAAGARHVCVVDEKTKLWCWGSNDSGQLGLGFVDAVAHPPTAVDSNGGPFTGGFAIYAGSNESCTANSLGTLFCWGGAFTCNANDGGSCDDAGVPTAEATRFDGISVQQLGIGDGFACAIGRLPSATTSSVACWGKNDDDLGASLSAASYATPQPVTLDGFVNPATIASGGNHTCVTDISGLIDCWGKSDDFSVGSVGGATAIDPVSVPGFQSAVDVQASASTTCVRLQNENVACIGKGDHGQLGVGAGPQKTATPEAVKNISVATSLAVGKNHVCAIAKLAGDPNASVVCWGANESGQLGNGTTSDSNVPVRALPPAP